MTTFCLVHGAWHDDACWAPLVAVMETRAHTCITPVLPLEDADAGFEDYARVVIDSLSGCEAPVLVGHSMSSAVIPLVAVERPVRLLVYLCPAMAGFRAPVGWRGCDDFLPCPWRLARRRMLGAARRGAGNTRAYMHHASTATRGCR